MNVNRSNRATVYSISYAAISESTINNVIGGCDIQFSGVWEKLPCAEVEFSEKLASDGCNVDLKVKIADTGNDMGKQLRALTSIYTVVLLRFSDGIDRVLGTAECPVRFSLDIKGSPSHYLLRYKGLQPEFPKSVKSF